MTGDKRFGPFRFRRREEPIKEWEDFAKALREFGVAVTKPLVRLADRLARRRNRHDRGGKGRDLSGIE